MELNKPLSSWISFPTTSDPCFYFLASSTLSGITCSTANKNFETWTSRPLRDVPKSCVNLKKLPFMPFFSLASLSKGALPQALCGALAAPCLPQSLGRVHRLPITTLREHWKEKRKQDIENTGWHGSTKWPISTEESLIGYFLTI